MPRTPGASRKGGLTRERIVTEAVALADADGVAGLSMRRLAERLGVEAMSLYHHVANKERLLDGMVDHVFGEIELPSPGAAWKAAMEIRARSARSVLQQHGWAVPIMDSRASGGPSTLRHHDSIIGCLRSAGFSVAMTAHAVSLIDSYVYGFVMQELALPFSDESDLAELVEDIFEHFPAEQYPHFAELATHHVLQPGYTYAQEFDFGLALILDGIEAARRKERSRSSARNSAR